jgi:quercetin dioxygenase-like cupin family protein
MNAISIENAEHYVWGSQCDGWHLLKSKEVSIIEERMPPNTSETTHFHNQSRQFFYVLDGKLSILTDGAAHVLSSGQGLEIVPGMKHRVLNGATSEVHFLVISSPPSHGDRVTLMD